MCLDGVEEIRGVFNLISIFFKGRGKGFKPLILIPPDWGSWREGVSTYFKEKNNKIISIS